MVGPCSSCGPFTQYCGHQSNSFSSMFWSSQYHNSTYNDDTDHYIYSSSSSSSSPSPSVDCTLSLGTPSTRLTSTTEINNNNNTTHDRPPSNRQHSSHRNSVSTFCWDLIHPSTKQHHQPSSKPPPPPNNSPSESLLARRCANCDTTSTPLWRNGPRGPKSLCNACGIRFKKEERRAAAATNSGGAHNNATGGAGYVDPSNGYYNGSWTSNPYANSTPQKMQSFGAPNEFRFIEDNDQRGSEPGIQFLSWLTHDRPSGLVHDFTR